MHLRHAEALLWCLALLAGPLAGIGPDGADALTAQVLSATLNPVGPDLPTDVGSGRLAVTLSAEGDVFSWQANLTGVTGVTKAHLHMGGPDEVGPVAVVLVPAEGLSSDDVLPTPLSGDLSVQGTFTNVNFLNQAVGLSASQFVESIAGNRVYMAVHTIDYPNGALRGQLEVGQSSAGLSPSSAPAAAPSPEPAASPPAASLPAPAIAPNSAQTVSAVLTPPSAVVGVTTGTFTATLNGGAFSWVLDLKNIVGLTKVHIHQGDRLVGGALVVGLLPVGAGSTSAMLDPPISGDFSYESSFSPADFNSVLQGASAEEFMRQAAEGKLYLNCHTVEAPDGAVSGVLMASGLPAMTPPPPPPAPVAASSSTSSSVPMGAIIGGAVGGVVLIAVVAGLFVWSRRRKQRGDGQALEEEGFASKSMRGPSLDVAPSKRGTSLDRLFSSQSKKRPSLDYSQSKRAGSLDMSQQKEASLPSDWGGSPGTDTFLPVSRAAPPPTQPYSYTAEHSQHSASTATRSKQLYENDPFLCMINSRLSSQPGTASGSSAPVGSRGAGAPGVGSLLSAAGGSAGGLSRGSSSLRPDMQQLAIKWDDLVIQECIGAGSFGRVYRARYFSTDVAVKVLLDPNHATSGSGSESNSGVAAGSLVPPPALLRSLEEETRVLSRIRHPNVLSLMGMCERPACIITEYCQHGSLYDVLRSANSDPQRASQLTWKLRLGMAIDAATGILYLHSRSPPIIHRDLKSPNLLVDKHFTVKVGDFNLSKILEESIPGTASANSMGGAFNPLWLAPEVLRGDKATAASDIFGFGIVMFELLTWRLPWVGLSTFKIMQAVLNGQRPELPDLEELPGSEGPFHGLNAYCQLMSDCWADNPADRPPVSAIIARLEDLLPLAPATTAR